MWRPLSPMTNTMPRETMSWSTGVFSRSAAMASSAWRASAAAARTWGEPRAIEALE